MAVVFLSQEVSISYIYTVLLGDKWFFARTAQLTTTFEILVKISQFQTKSLVNFSIFLIWWMILMCFWPPSYSLRFCTNNCISRVSGLLVYYKTEMAHSTERPTLCRADFTELRWTRYVIRLEFVGSDGCSEESYGFVGWHFRGHSGRFYLTTEGNVIPKMICDELVDLGQASGPLQRIQFLPKRRAADAASDVIWPGAVWVLRRDAVISFVEDCFTELQRLKYKYAYKWLQCHDRYDVFQSFYADSHFMRNLVVTVESNFSPTAA